MQSLYRKITLSASLTALALIGGVAAANFASAQGANAVADSLGSPQLLAVSSTLPISAPLATSGEETVYVITNSTGAAQQTFIGSTLYMGGEALPITLDIAYYLDGTEVSPEALAGKSGHLHICYTYTSTAEYQGTSVPFLAVTGVMLDGAKSSNVSIDNGKILTSGDNLIVMGYAVPGLSAALGNNLGTRLNLDTVTISADVVDFELPTAYTLFTSQPIAELDTSTLTSVDDLVASMNDLSAGLDTIIAGSGELSSGLSSAMSGTDSLLSGAKSLADGAANLSEGATTLAAGTSSLSEGASALASGASTLSSGVSALSSGASSLSDGIFTLSGGASALIDSSTTIKSALDAFSQSFSATLSGLSAAYNLDPAQLAPITQAYEGLYAGLINYTDGVVDFASGASNFASGTAEFVSGVSELTAGVPELVSGITELASGATEVASGASALASGAATLANGSGELYTGTESLHDGIAQLYAGSTSLQSGLGAFKTTGIDKLTNFANQDLADFSYRARQLVSAAASYHSYGDSTASSVKFIVKTH